MEQLVSDGEVTVNGQPAHLGMRVSPHDRLELRGRPIRGSAPVRFPRVLLYHKPEGEIVSRSDPEGRPSVFDRVAPVRRGRWIAIGRLDFNTCGLLIFTDSGELGNRLMHPRFQVEREYAVRVLGELDAAALARLRSGVDLDDGPARFERIESEGGEGSNHWYRVLVREGRNRLVRRLLQAVGLTVSRLMRTRFGPFALPGWVRRGQWHELERDQVEVALRALGVQPEPVIARPGGAPRRDFRDAPSRAGRDHSRGPRNERGPQNGGRQERPPRKGGQSRPARRRPPPGRP